MKVMQKNRRVEPSLSEMLDNPSHSIEKTIAGSWLKVAPFWPLKKLIAVNPIAGFEDLPFEEGLKQAQAYFQQKDLPMGMQHVNRESIKWLQVFFDEGQSTIPMPNRHLGFLKSTLSLIKFDKKIHRKKNHHLKWLARLPEKPESMIAEVLLDVGIPKQEQQEFLTLMLATLPGWASYIQYLVNWSDSKEAASLHKITQSEYLAFRLVLTRLIWPEARELLSWFQNGLKRADVAEIYDHMSASEAFYQATLLKQLTEQRHNQQTTRPKAQLVFCIDVRSEPFRRLLEKQGDYETYGFAGFFGVPVAVENTVTGEFHPSCPVLLKPDYTIKEYPNRSSELCKKGQNRLQRIKKLYQSLKYTFTTPFSLVEVMGLFNGIWMGLRTLTPYLTSKMQSSLKSSVMSPFDLKPDIRTIPLEKQIAYSAGALKMMGLTKNFAPLVMFCGHGSETQNNAYATALNCGACGGGNGGPNARILAAILNTESVREGLIQQGINIPDDTVFIAGQHNTTTDEVELYANSFDQEKVEEIKNLKQDLQNASNQNSLWRAHEMGIRSNKNQAQKSTTLRAQDWAQVRPEWGLARNAALIIAPRSLTKNVNLEGRSFLHSYEWSEDLDGSLLEAILTAPMVVAHWINAQYLFSTLDNVAFGGGSKTTKNITGKIGIMQGNASDLMHGLPLQSVYKSDQEAYHKAMRLTVVVYAPKTFIDPIIKQHAQLQKLFSNGWVHLICYDPKEKEKFKLQRDLRWDRL